MLQFKKQINQFTKQRNKWDKENNTFTQFSQGGIQDYIEMEFENRSKKKESKGMFGTNFHQLIEASSINRVDIIE